MSPELAQQIQILENRRRLAEDQLKHVQARQYDLAREEARLKSLVVQINNEVATAVERRSVS